MFSAIQIVGFFQLSISPEQIDETASFLACFTNSQKLKVDWKVFGGAWSKMSVANLVSGL